VEAVSPLVCLTLGRATFTAVLGPLQQLMTREKSAAVVTQRLMKLQSRGGPSRVPAEVLVRRRRRSRSKGTDVWEVVRARGHLDEVLELRGGQGGSAAAAGGGDAGPSPGSAGASAAAAQLVLTEGNVLGGGAFSRVSVVSEQTTGRTYALKRMRKSGVVQCPEHVFCEQTITRNLTHPFCIRQYASFQVPGNQADDMGQRGAGGCKLLSLLQPVSDEAPRLLQAAIVRSSRLLASVGS
jgi:cGMP-dependent protein kinase 2